MNSTQKRAQDLRIKAASENNPKKLRAIFKRLNRLEDWVSAQLVADRIRYIKKGTNNGRK